MCPGFSHALPESPGWRITSNTLQNSQCSLNVASATVSLNGNSLTLNLPLTFKPAFAGSKTVYSVALDSAGPWSGWQSRGSWTAQ
ncbi:MAG: hypothetical protein LAP38_12835 [Acidobacteriia bacterium]|nr:hypothetical protein [Terriglobia bacterium]